MVLFSQIPQYLYYFEGKGLYTRIPKSLLHSLLFPSWVGDGPDP